MIFWKYLKGLNEGEQSEGVTPQLFTYLVFSSETYVSNSKDRKYLPSIHINSQNSYGSNTDLNLGYIITSDAVNQIINEDFTFKDNKKINLTDVIWDSNTGEKYAYIQHLSSGNNLQLVVRDESEQNGQINLWGYRNCVRGGNSTTGVTFTVASDNVRLYASKSETSYGSNYKFSLNNNGDIDTKGYCQAAYFNATSDRRAKINIKPLSLSALELIKRVPICSFTYKDSDLPSIGIIAQDIQDIEIEGFKLVDNEQASGKDYDYMSIHESKLTYILWKAVQEQQKQIDLLKEEIEQLKKRG